ncbi:MAG: PAS domain S-box protein [Candidatus Omnitrophota bacterium]|jgi:PAS domain S-box-containing protein|nr:MAG: PAS domain S-box protein [Candidatus Omnitrophota bacterium]
MQELSLSDWLATELFERVPSNIAVLDREFRVVKANRNFVDAFGPCQGRHCYEIYRDDRHPCSSCQAALTFADGKRRVSEEQRRNRDGRYSHYVVHFEPIQLGENETHYILEMSRDVTATRLLQREHDIVFDRTPCYIAVLDRDMRIVRNNELFRKTFGESIGKRCYEIYQQQNELCEDCPARQTFHDRQVHSAYKLGRNKEGENIYYYVTTAPLSRGENEPSHVIEMALDMTMTRMLEQQLRLAFDFQESLIHSAIDGIIAVDGEGKINICNPSAKKMFKCMGENMIGQKITDRFVPHEFLDIVEGKGSCRELKETVAYDCDGEAFPVRFAGVALQSGDKHVGSAAFFQDLREIKQLELEKLEAERLAAVGQTVAGLAHGIKNVLMGLDGGMYVVSSGMKKDDKELTRKGWEMLKSNIERITSYVKDFLNFARGRSTLEVRPVDPNWIVREVVNLYKDVAEQAGILLIAEFQENINPANLDAEGIHTCLTNLVSNAIDACEMSEKMDCKVIVRSIERDDTLVFEVQDDGCGMDYEVKQKVFTTFFSTKEVSKGTGLGLLVTRRIAQEHGGKVEFDSVEGKGSVFRLVFPKKRLPALSDSPS